MGFFYKVAACRDLLPKAATAAERAAEGTCACGHAKPSVSAERAHFSRSNECRNGLHCSMPWSDIYYLETFPSLTHLALILLYTMVLDSQARKCSPHDLTQCQMG